MQAVRAILIFACFSLTANVHGQSRNDDDSDFRALSREDFRAQRFREFLREEGYRRIEFLDLKGRRFSATACKGDEAYRLTFSRSGRVIDRNREGNCDRPVESASFKEDAILSLLYGQGYDRVRLTDKTPPTLLASVCSGNQRLDLRLDTEGNVLDSIDKGRCNIRAQRNLRPAQIEPILAAKGYYNIRFSDTSGSTYSGVACQGIREFDFTVSRAATLSLRAASGFCDVKSEDKEFIPPRPFDAVRLTKTDTLRPEFCQEALSWLQYRTPITFSKGSFELTDTDVRLMDDIVRTLKRCPDTRVLIEGHTSASGDAAFNQELSEKRALTYEAELRERGIAGDRLITRGFGETRPAITEGEDAEEINRRIELVLEWGEPRGERNVRSR